MTLEKQQVMKSQAAAAAKSLSRVRLCVTPQTAARQAPLLLGLSRQEHWSGLPLPSPMHESEKWKGSRSVMSNSSQPHGLQPTRLLHPWDFPGKSAGVGCHAFSMKSQKMMQKKVICRSRPLVMDSELQSTSKKSWKQQKRFIYLTTDSWMSILCNMWQGLGIQVYI